MWWVIPHPIQTVCTGQSISEGKHHHLGSELFWAELTVNVSFLLEVKCVCMRVRVALLETWEERREQWHTPLSLRDTQDTAHWRMKKTHLSSLPPPRTCVPSAGRWTGRQDRRIWGRDLPCRPLPVSQKPLAKGPCSCTENHSDP